MTKIEWTDETWNPIVGCSVVSPGCKNCYAMRFAHRLQHHAIYEGLTRPTKAGPVWTGKVRRAWFDNAKNPRALTKPLHWRKPRRVFVNSMSDLFHEDVPDEWLNQIFAVMALSSRHTFQVLTKRPERMRDYLTRLARSIEPLETAARNLGYSFEWQGHALLPWPIKNIWLGTSVEDQKRADERIPHLLDTPTAVRFLSIEPLLGPVNLPWLRHGLLDKNHYNIVNWVICGGESGPGARPMHPDWARSLRDQCAAASVPFFFKQWGAHVDEKNMPDDIRDAVASKVERGHFMRQTMLNTGGDTSAPPMFRVGKKAAGRLLDGCEWNEWPEQAA